MQTITETPRVWVGCLACYNAGSLVGEWFDAVDAPTETDEWSPRVFGNRGPFAVAPEGHAEDMHEELWVMDHEGFHGLLTGECSPAEARELAELLDGMSEPGAFGAYVSNVGGKAADLADEFADAYGGEWDSEREFAEDLAEQCGFEAPDTWPGQYVDWDAATRDLFMSDYFSMPTSDYRVWVFRAL